MDSVSCNFPKLTGILVPCGAKPLHCPLLTPNRPKNRLGPRQITSKTWVNRNWCRRLKELYICVNCVCMCCDVIQRLDTVATVLHLLLWAPQHWIIRPNSNMTLPDDVTISWWLTLIAAEVHCYQCTSHDLKSPLQPVVSNSLRRLFLSRVNARDIVDAVTLLQICF